MTIYLISKTLPKIRIYKETIIRWRHTPSPSLFVKTLPKQPPLKVILHPSNNVNCSRFSSFFFIFYDVNHHYKPSFILYCNTILNIKYLFEFFSTWAWDSGLFIEHRPWCVEEYELQISISFLFIANCKFNFSIGLQQNDKIIIKVVIPTFRETGFTYGRMLVPLFKFCY